MHVELLLDPGKKSTYSSYTLMRRTRLRKKQDGSITAPKDRGLHAGPTPPYEFMSDAEVTRIIDTVITLMASSGIVFEPGTEADDLLPRIASKPDFHECRFCSWADRCWRIEA